MVRIRVSLGYTMAICLVLQHKVSTRNTVLMMQSEEEMRSRESGDRFLGQGDAETVSE